MKIAVFGGAGFLGSHVADVLTDEGHKVLIFDLKKTPYLKKGQVSIVGDMLDETVTNRAVKGCDVVYNFAGIADMDEAKKRPIDTIRNNIIGNAVLLEACRKNKVKRFIFASTLYVYSIGGSFYRSSKQACELIIENYREVYGLNFTVLRYGSLYGPRSGKDNWIYRALKQALTENKITRHGDGEELREYIHVHDAARLSAKVLENEYKNQYVMITGNQQIKIKDFLTMIREILQNKIKIEFKSVGSEEHYEITPYSFVPKFAKRIQGTNSVDLGQGILDLIGNIHREL